MLGVKLDQGSAAVVEQVLHRDLTIFYEEFFVEIYVSDAGVGVALQVADRVACLAPSFSTSDGDVGGVSWLSTYNRLVHFHHCQKSLRSIFK